MKYTVTTHNVHIEDSYKMKGRNFGKALDEIESQTYYGQTDVFDRSRFSLKMEWAVHNVLYRLGIKRAQTKDVDMDLPCDKPEWLYEVLGVLCWIFLWFLI